VATSIVIRQYIAKGFAYIAIIAISTVACFVIVLDILKYGFGIDPVCEERELIRRKQALLKRRNCETRKPLNIVRPRYVNKVSPSS